MQRAMVESSLLLVQRNIVVLLIECMLTFLKYLMEIMSLRMLVSWDVA